MTAPNEPAEDGATEETTPPADSGSGLTLQSLSDKVDRLFDLLKHGAGGTRREDPAAAAAEAVRGQVEQLRKADEAEKRRNGMSTRLDAIEARLTAITEKKPRERRKVETRMGWVGEDDE